MGSFNKKTFLCLIGLTFAVCVLAEKEVIDRYSSDSADILSRKIWTEIKKRLSDYGINDQSLADLDSELNTECTYNVSEGKIIRTKESTAAGATFINAPGVDSKDECMDECCSIGNCNIAVFKEQENKGNDCYLFDCGTPNVCKFLPHPGYIVVGLPARTTTDKLLEKHEDDLQNLAEPSTTTMTSTTTTAATTATPKVEEPVPLYGTCQSHQDCAGSWAKCLGGHCLCEEGYDAQDGVCRKQCGKFEFKCRNSGQPLLYPQCIAIYNKCDGMVLCKDGSDESDCSAEKKATDSHKTQNDDEESNPQDTAESTEDTSDEASEDSSKSEVHAAGDDRKSDLTDKTSSEDVTDDSDDMGTDTEPQSLSSEHVDDMSSSNLGEHEATNKETEENNKNTEAHPKEPILQKLDDSNNNNIVENPSNIQIVSEDNHRNVAMAEAESKTIFSKFYHSNKGAVVALSLGLTITAVLLVFVGCRLRNVKKRLRKGRPLNSNEADYLINGMYL